MFTGGEVETANPSTPFQACFQTNLGKTFLVKADWCYWDWHMSAIVYKWWHLADCKLSQFIKQQKFHFVYKHAYVTNYLAEKQQTALVVCHIVYP